jgi:hypothetical protein
MNDGAGLRRRWLVAMVLGLAASGVAAEGRVESVGRAPVGSPVGEACEGGVVVDDGTLETGYGWVPSAVDGRYVQRFERSGLGADRVLREICVCWTRSRTDADLEFAVELYADAGGEPRLEPTASLAATALAVPAFPGGAFSTVTIPDGGWLVPTEVYYVGVRWNPSADEFFFVCADRSEGTPVTGGFFTDDRADGWGNLLDTSDPIFLGHRAMMIRLQPGPPPGRVPAVGPVGAAALASLLALAGMLALRRHS